MNYVDEEDFCVLPADVGSSCDYNDTSSIRRFFFDNSRATCLEFDYLGCAGNLNNFDNYESCMEYCQHRKLIEKITILKICFKSLFRFECLDHLHDEKKYTKTNMHCKLVKLHKKVFITAETLLSLSI